MAVTFIGYVLERSPAERSARLVLLSLADRANDDGICWPAVGDTARRANISHRAAERALAKLIDADELIRVRPGGGRRRTTLMLLRAGRTDAELAPLLARLRGNPGVRDGVSETRTPTPTAGNPDADDEKPRHARRQTPAPVTGEPSGTTTNHQQTSAAADAQELLIAAGVSPTVAEGEATRDGVTPELVRAVLTLADRRRGVKNRAGFVLHALRDPSPELAEIVDGDQKQARTELHRCAEAEQLERDRKTIACIPPPEWPQAVEDACRLIRGRFPQAQPEREFKRIGQCADALPPYLVDAAAKVWERRSSPSRERT